MRTLYSRRNALITQRSITIKDEHGQIAYLITGDRGKQQDVLTVFSIHGEILAQIKQKNFGIFPRFDLYQGNQHVGSLRRYYGIGREILFVKGLNWLILGNIFTFNYKIYHAKTCLMTISEVKLTKGKYLEFWFKEINDEPIGLCLAAILDHWAQKNIKQKQKKLSGQHLSAWS
ncbi:LURP-one-related family protein [Ligilactobacillus sp. Marseille-Q7487]|uniref:LURP-one-related/scramblase family protein n=1 Tax=Ligilactobacillus sp. Marseille-Q7487 TaxID=3022128 RepID=UPI0024A7F0A0|nr:LURP-one-related family protein [Ligilactobacillus sp. Marseille-Q7487]